MSVLAFFWMHSFSFHLLSLHTACIMLLEFVFTRLTIWCWIPSGVFFPEKDCFSSPQHSLVAYSSFCGNEVSWGLYCPLWPVHLCLVGWDHIWKGIVGTASEITMRHNLTAIPHLALAVFLPPCPQCFLSHQHFLGHQHQNVCKYMH